MQRSIMISTSTWISSSWFHRNTPSTMNWKKRRYSKIYYINSNKPFEYQCGLAFLVWLKTYAIVFCTTASHCIISFPAYERISKKSLPKFTYLEYIKLDSPRSLMIKWRTKSKLRWWQWLSNGIHAIKRRTLTKITGQILA